MASITFDHAYDDSTCSPCVNRLENRACSAWYVDDDPLENSGMTLVNCGYGRSSCPRLTVGVARIPVTTTP